MLVESRSYYSTGTPAQTHESGMHSPGATVRDAAERLTALPSSHFHAEQQVQYQISDGCKAPSIPATWATYETIR